MRATGDICFVALKRKNIERQPGVLMRMSTIGAWHLAQG
jgi:hypothetical protein